jgi:hypothetical protein
MTAAMKKMHNPISIDAMRYENFLLQRAQRNQEIVENISRADITKLYKEVLRFIC